MISLSDRIIKLSDSKTLLMANKARDLKAKGIKVYDFTIGEPDFNTPDNIKSFAKKAIDNNNTKYTSNEGTKRLREAITIFLKNEFDIDYDISEVIVSTGAKQSIFNAIFSIINPGDEVIIPAPFYVSYPEIISLAGGKSVFIRTNQNDGFKITPERLEKAITPRTKLFILNNPCNPTGTTYNERELKELVEVLKSKNCYILSDEIYHKLVYDNIRFVSFAYLAKEIKERVILINGVSKTYSMTGWRIGFAAAVKEIIQAMNKIQSHSTNCASSISQEAAYEAFSGSQESVKFMINEFNKRRIYFYENLFKIEGISCFKSNGAFYLFPDVSSFFGCRYKDKIIKDSDDFAEFLLEFSNVAVVPGGASGEPKCVRISYATSFENIVNGVEKIKEAINYLVTTNNISINKN